MPQWTTRPESNQAMAPIFNGLADCIREQIVKNIQSFGTDAQQQTGVTLTLQVVLMPTPTGLMVSLESHFPPTPTVPPPPYPDRTTSHGESSHRQHHHGESRGHHQPHQSHRHRSTTPSSRRHDGSRTSTSTSTRTNSGSSSRHARRTVRQAGQQLIHHFYNYLTPIQLNTPNHHSPREDRQVRFNIPQEPLQHSSRPSEARRHRSRRR